MTPHGLYTTAGIRGIEQAALAGLTGPGLMERAGTAAARLAERLCLDGRPVLVLAGPGNNGGDALVAARLLRQAFHRVEVVFMGTPERLSADARTAHDAWLAAGGCCRPALPEGRQWGLVLDGLFGIGLARAPEGPYAELIARANQLGAPILALDVPSGLDADTGVARGATIRATHTLTFLAHKPGLFTADGPDHAGRIHLDTLGVRVEQPPAGWLLTGDEVAGLLPRRRRNTHKGSFGAVGVLGGATGMVGAPLLAGRAALKLGAGRVFVALLDEQAPSVDPVQPELMLRRPEDLFDAPLTTLVVGPGLGQSAAAARWLAQALELPLPLVVDADALNLIAQRPELAALTAARTQPTLLTPHPGEAARLLACEPQTVSAGRIEAAIRLSTLLSAFVALKGAGTVCAMPDGSWFINTSGNPGLASAGTGDVLAGMVGALLAQGLTARDALLAAVYFHGAAADRLLCQGKGPVGLTASELADAARALINEAL
jgi:hydroxyethylthiazole kinase-like uncharacterized protein yjeF